MPSERIQKQIDQHLDAAQEAGARLDRATAKEHAEAALSLDAENENAKVLLASAEGRGAASLQGAPGERSDYLAHDNTLDRDYLLIDRGRAYAGLFLLTATPIALALAVDAYLGTRRA